MHSRSVTYTSPVGPLPAYLTAAPTDDQKHPAIVWITGGDCNSIGDVWSPQPADNDQSAAAYRKAGIIMLFPSLRGGNSNRTSQEHFYGEVDDVLAAADFLATQPGVDPQRIYLGGHSTGGTLALLTAECSHRFRAIFSFGPVDNIAGYGNMFPIPFNTADANEFRLRNPINWLSFIQSPTLVIEGQQRRSNIDCLNTLAAKCPANVPVDFIPVPNHTHFSVLAPMNALLAQKILSDTGPTCNIIINPAELPN